ncbi:hypothetical protein J1N35_030130 [Gossypium stocksii]|uniref:RNase H type-1 domain-containing protein n=1 Tax=Gossypium stocksii TaxID=47602 RepID=A0A9D3UZA4_9ROSI|nr:hypothetical protein J1N35_030130 [Gossypium stocksii]
MGPLNQYISGHCNIDPETKVNEMVLGNGDWNLDLFRLWLLEEVVKHIISIPPSLNQAGPDILSWSKTTTGDITSVSYSWAKHFLFTHNEVSASQPKQSLVRQNSGMCVFLNTDGAVNSTSGSSAVGGVIHNSYGEWILGYNRFLGDCLIATAEL